MMVLIITMAPDSPETDRMVIRVYMIESHELLALLLFSVKSIRIGS